jgi:hypothetical protein
MSFISQILSQEGGTVRYIKAVENGRPAWFFVKLNPEQYSQYKKAIKSRSLELKDFGEIIASGWGEEAPKDVIDELKRQYDIK